MFDNITNVADAGGVGKDAVGSSNMNTGTSGSGSVAMGMNGFHAHVQFPAADHNSTNRSFAADATSTNNFQGENIMNYNGVNLLNNNSASAASASTAHNNNHAMNEYIQHKHQRRMSTKRTHSDKHNIVSGRSFKRLRLDQTVVVHVPNNTSNSNSAHQAPSLDAQSTGTLSVGTMGGDLESNDEEDDDDDEIDDNDEEEEGSRGEECGEESCASSWVASLPSLSSHNLRRRRKVSGVGLLNVGAGGILGEARGLSSVWPCSTTSTTTHAAQLKSAEDEDDIDDTATCSEMTTAAVAPRRKYKRSMRHRKVAVACTALSSSSPPSGAAGSGRAASPVLNGERKRRAIGFMIETPPIAEAAVAATKSINFDDDLVVEELELDEIPTAGQQQQQQYPSILKDESPPIECIPDPLLVAAQHAAGGERGAAAPCADEGAEIESAGGSLFLMGDCYSSVTEEETSLAEDEASLSAISIGGKSTTSAGGIALSIGGGSGINSAEVNLSLVRRSESQETVDSMEEDLKPAAMMMPPSSIVDQHSINNLSQHQEKSMRSAVPSVLVKTNTSDYSSLNHLLAGLHQERQRRSSLYHQSGGHQDGGSSLNSLGSMGMDSTEGNSHQSCPTNMLNSHRDCIQPSVQGNLLAAIETGHHINSATTSNNDAVEDMEMGGMSTNIACSTTVNLGSSVGGGSVQGTSVYDSQAGSCGNSRASCCDGTAGDASTSEVPKWKRRVNLPSHSSLY